MAEIGARGNGASGSAGLCERICRKMAEAWFGPIDEADWTAWLSTCQAWCPGSKSSAPDSSVV